MDNHSSANTSTKIVFRLLKYFTKFFSGTRISRIPILISIHRFIYKSSHPHGIVLINCHGNKMYINAEDNGVAPDLLTKAIYEPLETELLKNLLTKDMTVVNIGANIGYYTLIAANIIGPNGRVFAFEPEPENYKLLLKNIKENGYKNIIPIQAAVSDKQGTLKLFLDKFNLGNPSLAEQNIEESNGYIDVETNKLDNFIEKYSRDMKVDLIQMDTQGCEGLILDGASKIMLKNKLRIIMEFWPYGLSNLGTDASVLLKKIESYGFKIRIIDETNKRISSLLSKNIIDMCKSMSNGRGYVNLLLEK
jgi:FkbM family methyltransferase